MSVQVSFTAIRKPGLLCWSMIVIGIFDVVSFVANTLFAVEPGLTGALFVAAMPPIVCGYVSAVRHVVLWRTFARLAPPDGRITIDPTTISIRSAT